MKKILMILILGIILFGQFVISQDEIPSANETIETNNTNLTVEDTAILGIKNIIPRTFEVGDSQFSIQVENKQNTTLSNIFPVIIGNGFSTYEAIPIENLDAFGKGYILVSGNFREAGNITLTIKINSETFYENVSVTREASTKDIQAEQEQKAKLESLTWELNKLEENYTLIEQEINDKKENSYDVSQISITDLKKYLRNARSGIFANDAQEAELNLKLAEIEYDDVKELLDNVKKMSIFAKIKENAVFFSAIAGAILTFFTLYELLKKKKERLEVKIKEMSEKGKKKE